MNNRRINDRYEIQRPIGGGGMADVYLARDIILDRDVAVKVLKPQFSEDQEFIRRFRREAQAATSLSHPNVVNIYDVGEEDKLYYIVMEYIQGNTLKDYIQQKGKLHVHDAVNIMEQITSAIQHAHENHIIHRDIKPHNILIGRDGTAKVTDFGIARAISEATITHTNSVLGSVHYLSPEQARGGNVTYKSDIYSLGIVMYEMLAGEVPFNGDTAVSVAIKHLQSPLPFLRDRDPSIPQSVENVVIRATAKDPLKRYPTADDMVGDLFTVFDPSRNAEKRLALPISDDESTIAIPIFGNEENGSQENTMIHQQKHTNQPTNNGDNPQKEKKRSKGFWISIIIGILFFIFAAMWVAFSLIPSWLHVDEVTIPEDLVGMEFEEASEVLTDLELKFKEERRHDEEVEEGHVISHDPEAGESVKVGTQVNLVVSEGTEPIEMAEVIGEPFDQAERMLQDFQDIEIEYEESSDYDDDTVLAQSPEPGELIIPEKTVVTLTLSERPTYIMANLLGMSQEEVLTSLSTNRLLELEFEEEFHPTIEEGKVVSQDPPRGTEIRNNTKVKVIFSKGPEPEEEPEEQPITVNVPFDITEYIQGGGNNGNNGNNGENSPPTYDVTISVIDLMRSEPDPVIERELTQGELNQSNPFYIPMTVAPGMSGFLIFHVDGELVGNYEYTYEELKEYQ